MAGGGWNGREAVRRTGRRILGLLCAAAVLLAAAKGWSMISIGQLQGISVPGIQEIAKMVAEYGFRQIRQRFYPSPVRPGMESGEPKGQQEAEEDPAYRAARAAEAFWQEHGYLALYGNEETGLGTAWGNEPDSVRISSSGNSGAEAWEGIGAGEKLAVSARSFPGQTYQLAQLEDYDFLMSHFYNVHTSTTAGRDLMNARKLLSRNFQLDSISQGQESRSEPEILIYHTHSQEAFADSKEGENVVAVGAYLAELLTEKGFSVYHDQTVYDVRDGELDRNKAYTYALEGITQILEEHPSIQVVIDLHRDGVGKNTRLVTEIDGKQTAQIMFFNGLSQTPDGPIPYLENPNREDNLAFSLQLQLKAAAYYPGFTRKIYLKGLRYNQHLRPCSCLIEAGAQTNTYQEVRNAMEPLAEVFTMVLRGN